MIPQKKRANSRQILSNLEDKAFPNNQDYKEKNNITAEAKLKTLYDDILYGYLQTISIKLDDSNKRYINKNQISFSNIAKQLGKTYQTISKHFKILEGLGLIVEDKLNKRYEIVILSNDNCALIPNDVLTVLTNIAHPRAISLYAYFLKRHLSSKDNAFNFTKTSLNSYLGISTNNRRDNIVEDCLKFLAYLKLIEYDTIDIDGPLGIEKRYRLTQIYNTLPISLIKEESIKVTKEGWRLYDKGKITWEELKTNYCAKPSL